MNIYSNVNKEDNSKKFLLIGISLLLVVVAYAYKSATDVVQTTIQSTNGMSEIDKIKQQIREKEFYRDQFSEVGKEAAEEGDFDKSKEMADKVNTLVDEIKQLYDDLHEANMREGENGSEDKTK